MCHIVYVPYSMEHTSSMIYTYSRASDHGFCSEALSNKLLYESSFEGKRFSEIDISIFKDRFCIINGGFIQKEGFFFRKQE